MGLFDFLKPKKEPKHEKYTSILPPEQESDDTVKPEEMYRPDVPRPEPVDVPHISLTYEEAIKQGWHFKRKSRRRIRITHYTGTEKNVIIPAEIDRCIVNELGKNAFLHTDIDSAMLPATLRKLGEGCFQFSKLRRVVFEDGLTMIPRRMFYSCVYLEHVRLSEHLYRIGFCAFDSCLNLKYISITNSTHIIGVHIEDHAFSNSGLECYAIRPTTYAWFNGTVFENTPMQRKYKLILSPERAEKTEYKVLLVGREVHGQLLEGSRVKFPKNCFVSLREGSLSHDCFLDLSQCGSFWIDGKALPYTTFANGHIWFPMRSEIRVPQGYRGGWFSEKLRVTYPDGTLYTCETGAEKPDADTAVLTLYGDRMQSYSMTCKARNVIIRMKANWTKFEQDAIDSQTLEHLTLENLHGGEGMLFNTSCRALHCVEWQGNTVYLPSAGLVGEWVHRQLLKAFCGQNSNGIVRIFDGSVPERIFNDEKKGTRLSQRQRILLAVDVLRSTESLFPDRTPYLRYLQTHKRYALLLCRDLPEEYAGFLRDFE